MPIYIFGAEESSGCWWVSVTLWSLLAHRSCTSASTPSWGSTRVCLQTAHSEEMLPSSLKRSVQPKETDSGDAPNHNAALCPAVKGDLQPGCRSEMLTCSLKHPR